MENRLKNRDVSRKRRSMRVRKNVRGTSDKPRLCVFRSNKHLLAQLIDDEKQTTLSGIGTMSKDLKDSNYSKKSKEAAKEIGKRIAQEAKKIKSKVLCLIGVHTNITDSLPSLPMQLAQKV